MNINAREFDIIARDVFAPVYPVIAGQILDRTGIRSGRGLDIGCGSGYLGLALIAGSNLDMTFFDASEDMLSIARDNIGDRNLGHRATTLSGDVARIPLQSDSVDLAVSRGSIFFWDRPDLAFAEIHRVLAPGGRAVIGGGFGSANLREKISRIMEARDKKPGQWRNKLADNLSRERVGQFEAALQKSGVPAYTVDLNDETGLWITISKQEAPDALHRM